MEISPALLIGLVAALVLCAWRILGQMMAPPPLCPRQETERRRRLVAASRNHR